MAPGERYSSAELYDPTTGTFSPTGSMWVARSGHTATLLGNGMVLLTGSAIAGSGGTGKAEIMAELYDPTTGSSPRPKAWTKLMTQATGLSDGGVLLTGGSTAVVGGSESIATAELFRP